MTFAVAKVVDIDALTSRRKNPSSSVRKNKMSKMTPDDFKEMNEESKKNRGISNVRREDNEYEVMDKLET